MSNIFWKHFNLCFSHLRCFSTAFPPPPPPPSQLQDQSLLSSQTPKKNIDSHYSLSSDSTSKSLTSSSASGDLFFSSGDSDSPESPPPPDLATIFASQRFFFSSPGNSNSILDSPPFPPPPPTSSRPTVAGGVAIQTYSPDPLGDFRRSMQEMVEAREMTDVEGDWDYLHELLLCYLMLNPKHTHKFIVGAFSDLLISLMPSTAVDSRREVESIPKSAVSLRLM